MTPYYSLNNIPQDIPPFASLVGLDDCILGVGDVFVKDYRTHQGHGTYEMKDMGTHILSSFDGYMSSIVLKKPMTDKEYIEYLYSFRDYNFQLSFSHSALLPNSTTTYSSFSIDIDYTYYPIFDDHGGSVTYNTAKYLAPPSRCLLNNAFISGHGTVANRLEHVWFEVNSISGATYDPTGIAHYTDHSKTFLLFGQVLMGSNVFFRRVDIWERELYIDDNGNTVYFSKGLSDEINEGFGYLGRGLQIFIPEMKVVVPHTSYGFNFHQTHQCNFVQWYDPQYYGAGEVNAMWTFTFDGVDYDSYFNVVRTSLQTTGASISASSTVKDSYFNFLDE